MPTLGAKNATNNASQDPLDVIFQLFYYISLLNLHGWEWCLEKILGQYGLLAILGLSCRCMSVIISPLQCQMYAHIMSLVSQYTITYIIATW
jgi:hypothetical protein